MYPCVQMSEIIRQSSLTGLKFWLKLFKQNNFQCLIIIKNKLHKFSLGLYNDSDNSELIGKTLKRFLSSDPFSDEVFLCVSAAQVKS